MYDVTYFNNGRLNTRSYGTLDKARLAAVRALKRGTPDSKAVLITGKTESGIHIKGYVTRGRGDSYYWLYNGRKRRVYATTGKLAKSN